MAIQILFLKFGKSAYSGAGMAKRNLNSPTLVETSFIFERTDDNGSSGTRERLFWLRFNNSVPPDSLILTRTSCDFSMRTIQGGRPTLQRVSQVVIV